MPDTTPMPAVEAPGPRSEALPQGDTTPSAEADAALLEGVPGIDHPLDVSELSQAAAAIAAAQHEQKEQEALDAILADLNDVDADVADSQLNTSIKYTVLRSSTACRKLPARRFSTRLRCSLSRRHPCY